jgi:hypothetical protein
MDKALGGLADEFAKLREGGWDFLAELKLLEIPKVMSEGEKAASVSDSRTLSERAGEALSRLESLIRSKGNCISGMCRNDEPQFSWPQDLAATLQQLMRSLVQCRGSGASESDNAGGAGPGIAGFSEHGYWMRGRSQRLPVYGPDRMSFARTSRMQAGGGGPGGGRAAEVETAGSSVRPRETKTSGEAIAAQAVPEPYREAVRRYFSENKTEEDPPPANTTNPSEP